MTIGRALISLGVLLACLGILLVASEKVGLPFGRLPGDLHWSRGNTTIYFPLATCIVISVVGTILLWLFGRR